MDMLLRFSLLFIFFSTWAHATPTDKHYRQLAINCVQCHADPSTNAPLIGDTKEWSHILLQGKETVLNNLYLGKKGMPPLGYCSSCSQEDFITLIKLMAGPTAAEHFESNHE